VSNALSRLRKLAQGNRGQKQPSLFEFVTLDVDQISTDLELEKRGEERGKDGQPLTGSTTFDTVEREILDKVQSFQLAAVEHLTGQLDICSERLRRLQFDSMVISVKSETTATVADFEHEGRNGLNTLFQLRRELIDATDALELFKKEQSINRPAHRKANTLHTWLILGLIFLIETLANAGLIGSAHESGYIGAYTLAVSLSFINVISGFAAGYFGLRSAHHNEGYHRVWGVGLVGAYLSSTFIFNLYIAHVRDAMQSDTLQIALNQVWSKLQSFSFDFHDYQAPLMLIIGIAFSLVAFYKGFKNDDPYPDYGRQSRLRDETEATYADQFAELGDQLTYLRDEVKKTLQDVAIELGFRRTEYFGVMETIDKLISRFKSHERQLESNTQRLLNVYRDANRKARSKGEPKHFKREFKLDGAHIPSPNVDAIYPKETVQSLIEEAKELIHKSIDDIDNAHRASFKRYDLISQILDKTKLEEVVVAVSEEKGENDGA
jgi:AraC-like DNA-binding protein